jgi:hypothetical protein
VAGFFLPGGIIYRLAMPTSTTGFDILVYGSTWRTFRDREDIALEAAQQLAGKRGNDPVRVRNRATGATVTVTSDGAVTPA